jgi:uncharacterized phage protein (TIGR02220 family)
MGNPKTDGRMIRKSIADSKDFSMLSPEAAVLFCMILPHLDSHGKIQGGAAFIKEIVCPKIKYLTIKNIPQLLTEISNNTDMKWFEYDDRNWIHALRFSDHQKLDLNKIGRDLLPNYSGLISELVTHKDKDKEEVKEEVKRPPADVIPYKEIISYLNDKTGKNFDYRSKETRARIKARWGVNGSQRSLDDFKRVIDNKCAQWLTDEKMISFLRPETLFGTKFESYLNEIVHASKKEAWEI